YGKTKQRPQGEHAPRQGKKQTDNSGKPAVAATATAHEDAGTGAALLAELRAEQERARRTVADHCRQQADAIRQRELRRRLTAEESREATAAIEKLARKLVSRQSLRQRHAWRGSVDLKQTLARSVRSGGVPFQLYHRRRSRTRHKLLVLCDVSGSVRHAAALLLHLVYHLQNLFAHTHSLVFVDRPVDVTDLFQRFPCAEALQRMSACEDLNQNAYSDYGNTFYELLDDYPRLLDRDTVLLILGDARTNQFDPMPWAFAEIRRRTRRILWLNPEPPGRWNTQDSAIAVYTDACDALFPCNNLAELEHAAQALAAASHS
ncbi:MAG TPA: VWA domain-containing protein, partial [Armatimonadota bacterium]|nr:VWA domain-containing protein [Armatimonadota bacterium]